MCWQASYAAAHQVSLSRGKRDVTAYTRGMLKARYCIVPVMGDGQSAGRRFFDALAAGCAPLLVGSTKPLIPFADRLDAGKFSQSISRAAFLKDPVIAVEQLIHRLEPTLPVIRRGMADARQHLGYGTSEFGPFANATVFADAAVQLLLEADHLAANHTG